MPQLIHNCPRCHGPLPEASTESSTYVVNGESVCSFICYMEATNGAMAFTAESLQPVTVRIIHDIGPP